jgi:hypothetical protein
VRQRGRGREPARHGVWAFLWPVMDLFLAAHKYEEVMPKRLRQDRGFSALAMPAEADQPQTPEQWEALYRERER